MSYSTQRQAGSEGRCFCIPTVTQPPLSNIQKAISGAIQDEDDYFQFRERLQQVLAAKADHLKEQARRMR